MTPEDLTSLINAANVGRAAQDELDSYASSILDQVHAEAKVWRERHCAGLGCYEGVQFTYFDERDYSFDGYTLDTIRFEIKVHERRDGGYGYETFSAAVFTETDDARRLDLIRAEFETRLAAYETKRGNANAAREAKERAELARLKALYPSV